LISHGNAGTVAERLELARAFVAMGRSVLLYDYRGYGRSQGRPSEEGTYLDAEAAFDWLTARGLAPQAIAAYGESLGGAVSIELARRRDPARLIVEATFTSLPDIGARAYPWLPVHLLSRIRYDNIAKAPELTLPVLVLHSPEDELVPFAHAHRLYDALGGERRLVETGGPHNAGGFGAGDQPRLAALYARAGDAAEAAGEIDAACFYLTHAYVFALAAGAPEAAALHARLLAYGREE